MPLNAAIKVYKFIVYNKYNKPREKNPVMKYLKSSVNTLILPNSKLSFPIFEVYHIKIMCISQLPPIQVSPGAHCNLLGMSEVCIQTKVPLKGSFSISYLVDHGSWRQQGLK
jgi:hypothetical protein